jgi:hypothetical protein
MRGRSNSKRGISSARREASVVQETIGGKSWSISRRRRPLYPPDATCFGQGVGPLAVGVVNDALKTTYDNDAVRYSLLSAAVTTTLGALLFVWAARFIRADIKRAA